MAIISNAFLLLSSSVQVNSQVWQTADIEEVRRFHEDLTLESLKAFTYFLSQCIWLFLTSLFVKLKAHKRDTNVTLHTVF